MENYTSPLTPRFATRPGERLSWGRLYGSGVGLSLTAAADACNGLLLVVTADTASAARLEDELRFFVGQRDDLPVLHFPDWETLPYDVFSPHQDIISERVATLYRLPSLTRGILVLPVATLMQRLAPREYIEGSSLVLDLGQRFDMDLMRSRLERSGYQYVSQVMEHGEFTVRGSLIDLYPMGAALPYRIELFDDEVESIRTFDPESQRSLDKVERVRLLPAREFPLHEDAIKHFRQAYREVFEGDPKASVIYRDVSNGLAPPGIEYFIPLFFEHTHTLVDYLPEHTYLFTTEGVNDAVETFWGEAGERFELGRLDRTRPLLPPNRVFLEVNEAFGCLKRFPRTDVQRFESIEAKQAVNFATEAPPRLTLDARTERPSAALQAFVDGFDGRILFATESPGRREALLEILRSADIHPTPFDDFATFLRDDARHGLVVAPLENGLLISEPPLAVVAETQLYGEQVMQRRRRQKSRTRDADAVVRSLAELQIGSPVVHEDHGVGRYLGLQKLHVGDIEAEFLTLEYADGDKLYVPVASLHLISRYTGGAPETTPLHKLGSGQWERAKRRASEKVRDVAAELLDLYARRAARQGFTYPIDRAAYAGFAATFAFETTPDQQDAIDAVLNDMASPNPMDRLVCGDVGFGKTEVA
ncbi:MAG: CarD family transcriptional regulator, partial [Hydrogenophaga sp.]